MMSDYFNNPDTEEVWYTYEENGLPVAIGYCIPEKLTVGTYNLLALGVKKKIFRAGDCSRNDEAH